MDPNNPKPNNQRDGQIPPTYNANDSQSIFAPRQFSESEEVRPNMTHAFPWRNPDDAQASPAQPGVPPVAPSASPSPSPSQQPMTASPEQPQWVPPTTAMPPASSPRPPQPSPGTLPQFGGPMAELPPLVGEVPQPTHHHKKKKSLRQWLIIAGITAFAILFLGLIVAIVLSLSNSKKQEQQKTATITPVSYNAEAIKKTVNADGTIATGAALALNKTSTFYTVFKQAAMQPVVHTKWDVYYTAEKNAKRTDQYTMFDVAVDYRTKTYSYSDDAYSNIGVLKTRCIDDQQYTYNGSKLAAVAGWQPASDSTTCKLSVVATRMSDGVNTGGLTEKQADTFVKAINQSQSVSVSDLKIVEKNGKRYLRLAVQVTPKMQASKIYWGMQNFLDAFQATGVSSDKHPYTYFGPANAGMKMDYWIDPATLLPVYATMDVTEGVNEAGMKVTPETWSQRAVEYDFPKEVAKPTLDDANPITFTTWPEY